MSESVSCSAAILTYNSEKNLQRALESVKTFSDIIVCDGGSTDATLDIAREYGVRIINQDSAYLDPSGYIRDFSGVRNQTLEAARESWFFFVDSDEYASSELVATIRDSVAGESCAYWVHRKYEVSGVRIDCASTYPNKNMRFFHRDAVTNFIKPVHERISVREGAPVHTLPESAPLMVPVFETPQESRIKNRRYITAEIARSGPITVTEWIRRAWRRFLISGLYALRTLRSFGCKGKRMPLAYEWNRHWYHFVLTARELSLVRGIISIRAAAKV